MASIRSATTRTGPSASLARKYLSGRSSERASLTVIPSTPTSAYEPSRAATASGSPEATRARASSGERPLSTLRAGSVRSTTRATERYIGPPASSAILARRVGAVRPASDARDRQAGEHEGRRQDFLGVEALAREDRRSDAGENRDEEAEAHALRDAERAHGPEPEAEGDDERKERRQDCDHPRRPAQTRVVLPEHVGQRVRENHDASASEGRDLRAERREEPGGAGGRHVVDGPGRGRPEAHEVTRRAAEVGSAGRADEEGDATPGDERAHAGERRHALQAQEDDDQHGDEGRDRVQKGCGEAARRGEPEGVEPLVHADARQGEDESEAARAGRGHEPLAPRERLEEEKRGSQYDSPSRERQRGKLAIDDFRGRVIHRPDDDGQERAE